MLGLLLRVTVARFVQPAKAALPILVTLAGMSIEVNPALLQYRKASPPIIVKLSGRLTELRLVQPWKAP